MPVPVLNAPVTIDAVIGVRDVKRTATRHGDAACSVLNVVPVICSLPAIDFNDVGRVPQAAVRAQPESMPCCRLTVPVKVFAPDSIAVPGPVFVSPAEPRMFAEISCVPMAITWRNPTSVREPAPPAIGVTVLIVKAEANSRRRERPKSPSPVR